MISVVIPTRNRADKLRRALEAMSALKLRTVREWELIVVDNNSTDDTHAVVAAVGAAHPTLPLRVVAEPRTGLSAARNRGAAAARFPIIAITDDDCIVTPSWLDDIDAAFARGSSSTIIGGRVTLYDKADAPLATRDFADPCRITTLALIRERLIGCNFAISAAGLARLGGFDTAFGPPNAIRSADDHELFYRALRAGLRLDYEPSIHVMHGHGRRTAAEVAATRGRDINGYGGLLGRHLRGGDHALAKPVYWEMRRLLGTCLHPGRLEKGARRTAGRQLWSFAAGLAAGLARRPQRAGPLPGVEDAPTIAADDVLEQRSAVTCLDAGAIGSDLERIDRPRRAL